jgi:ketosteroid isomerase-like protein
MKSLVVFTAALAAACAGTQSSSDGAAETAATAGFSPADSAAIVALAGRLVTAARGGNWDAWGAEYIADPVRFPPNAPILVGKAAADAFNRASPTYSVFEATATYVVGRGDVAVASGTYKVMAPAGKDADGKATPATNDEGKWMQLLIKQADGTWKIARDMWNSDLPMAGSTTQ